MSMQATHARNFMFWQQKPVIHTGQVVMVTGAGSGIGLNVSLVYSSRQSKLILLDRDLAALEASSLKCKEAGAASVMCLQCDVTDFTAVQAVFKKALDEYKVLDVLVLCAGIGAHHLFEATESLEIFHKLMAVNFYGYLNCTRAAYKSLCESNGLLIAVTSFSGEVGLPYRTAYCASKFAVTGFLESLRSEMSVTTTSSNSFHITIVCPPTVNTNLRRNALTPDPSLKDAPSANAMTVADCAAAIVDAGDRKLRKAFFPFNSWIASYLRPILPDAMDKFIMKRAKL